MKRLCISSDEHVLGLSEDIIIEILHRLPSKSLATFECVCKQWRKYIADPSLVYSCRSQRQRKPPQMIGFFCQDREPSECSDIRFFFSLEKSSEVIDGILDESVAFLGRGVYIIASSNGFILVAEDLRYQRVYYVYNPLTRQPVAVPVTQTSCIDRVAVGFLCKVDDPEKDVIDFTIVRYEIWFGFRSNVTIESFSSETNVWTTINLTLDVPLQVVQFSWTNIASVGVIDGVFCWIDLEAQIIFYDSVKKCFWGLQLPEEMTDGDSYVLGISGGALYYALYKEGEIIVWCLESNIRSRDVIWIRKYAANISNALVNCPGAFGFADSTTGILDMDILDIHPANPHMFYFHAIDKVISYDLEKNVAVLLHDIEEPSSITEDCLFFSYELYQWPRFLWTYQVAKL